MNLDETPDEFIHDVKSQITEDSKDCEYLLELSFGVKKYDGTIKNEAEFIKRADAELYKKKKERIK